MAVLPFWPPKSPGYANWEYTGFRCLAGPPKRIYQLASIQEGLPIVTSASATLTQAWNPGDPDILLDNGDDFLYENAAVRVFFTDDLGVEMSWWLSYPGRSDTTLLSVSLLNTNAIPSDRAIPGGASVEQWRDITGDVTKIRRSFSESGSGITWAVELTGRDFNSRAEYQDASYYIETRYANDRFGGPTALTPWIPWFYGSADPVRPAGDHEGTDWVVTVRGEAKLLEAIEAPFLTLGNRRAEGTYSMLTTQEDLGAEPYEGNGVADFAAARMGDDDIETCAIGTNIPSIAGVRDAFPGQNTGGGPIFRPNNRTMEGTGYGMRIEGLYLAPIGSPRVPAPEQQFIELAYMGPDPAGWPYIDDIRTILQNDPEKPRYGEYITTTIPATADPESAFPYDLSRACLDYGYGPDILWRVYLGKGDAISVPRGSSVVLCKNKKVFDEQNTVLENLFLVEYQQCEGWRPGLDPSRRHRGVGAGTAMDPRGGWLALREDAGQGANFGPLYYPGSPQSNLVVDTIDANGMLTVDTDVTAMGYADHGHLMITSDAIQYPTMRIRYTGRSGNSFTGCQKVGSDKMTAPDDRTAPGQQIAAGMDVRQAAFAGNIRDLVAWGDTTIPARFPLITDVAELDQNDSGYESNRVWGYRGADGYSSDFVKSTTAPTVAPGGVTFGQYLKRYGAMGGGVYRDDPTDPADNPFREMDGGTAADWEILPQRIIGNAGSMATWEIIRWKATEHAAAVVTIDRTAFYHPFSTVRMQEIDVQPGQADEYLGHLRPGERIRTDSGIEFTYTHHDHQTFYGVVKINTATGQPYDAGLGPTIAAGEALYTVIDTNTNRSTASGEPPRWEARNLPACYAMQFKRHRNAPAAAVFADTHKTNGQIVVGVGQGELLPTSGTLTFEYGGSQNILSFASRVGDVLSGVSLSPEIRAAALPAGTLLGLGVVPSYIKRARFYVSRRPYPSDPLTNYGANPDWEEIHAVHGGYPDSLLPLAGPGENPYIGEIVGVVEEMSDGGPFKSNEWIVWRLPADEPNAEQARLNHYDRVYDAARVANEMLALAGVPKSRRDCRGGPLVRGVKIGGGSWWSVLTGWCAATGMVIEDGPLGIIKVRPDPRRPGGTYTQVPALILTPNAIWGKLSAGEQKRHAISQIAYDFYNDLHGEHYRGIVPPVPLILGAPATPISGRRATSRREAADIARLMLARANGGWQFQGVPVGHFDDLRWGDFVRVSALMDEGGVLFDGFDTLVTTGSSDMADDVETCSYDLQQFVSI